jgi:hypothetical protein
MLSADMQCWWPRVMSDPSLYEILIFDQLATRVVHALVW